MSRSFVFEYNVRFCVNHHVNVIIYCDKFEHDLSNSTKIHQCDVLRELNVVNVHRKHDVRDMSWYDVRRVFENVILLIKFTKFFVRLWFKCHVNVIIYCDKFEHDFSSSIKLHHRDVFRELNVVNVREHDRVFENVILLIKITKFFVRFWFKRHVNVIICCDKFEHNFSNSIKIHQYDVLRDLNVINVHRKHDFAIHLDIMFVVSSIMFFYW
jgi:hypothetical protein